MTTDRPQLSEHGTTLLLAGLGIIAAGIIAPFGPSLTGIFLFVGAAVLLVGVIGGLILGRNEDAGAPTRTDD